MQSIDNPVFAKAPTNNPAGQVAPVPDKAPRPQLEKGQFILCDGDSMTSRRSEKNADTWPYLRLMNWDKVWPDIMAELLFCWRAELSLSYFNAASQGSTCRGLAERFDRNVLPRKPQWVIASVAGNDVRVGISVDEYRSVMTTYAKRITEEIGGQVLFFGASEQGPDYPKQASLPGRRAFYDVLAEIAADLKGVYYADIGPRLAAKAKHLQEQYQEHTIYGDNGHYNAVGHTIIAGEILRIFGVVN